MYSYLVCELQEIPEVDNVVYMIRLIIVNEIKFMHILYYKKLHWKMFAIVHW